ncbi:MAG TPA: amidohydrolase family protein [Gemmatimonadaceae bacterium]|nr:amidohydrolase family protein [Gemmatimonadaceae bacterium]
MRSARCIVSTAAILATVVGSGARAQATRGDLVIRNVTVISPERAAPLAHADVIIRDGGIAEIGRDVAVGPGARRIDGTGRFLIPGLIDSHVHVGHSAALDEDAIDAHPELWAAYRSQVPRAYLAFGYTSVVDLDLLPNDQSWFESTPIHPRLYSCGRGIKVAQGYGAWKVPPTSSPRFPNLVYEPREASHWPDSLNVADYTPARAVSRAADARAICVKAFVESGFGIFNWPYLHTRTLQQIRTAAAARRMALIVHANAVDSWRSALDAHANTIAHGLWIWPGRATSAAPTRAVREVIAAAAAAHTRVQPTLRVVAGERAFFDPSLLDDPRLGRALPPSVIAYLRSASGVQAREALLAEYRKMSPAPGFERLLAVAIERTHATFSLMLQDHVPLLFGSDTPSGDGFGNPPGLNGRLEMQEWARLGAPLALILRAATLDNAVSLGLSDSLGSIQPGKRADLLLLGKNPLANISAYDAIETVLLNGVPMARDSLAPRD